MLFGCLFAETVVAVVICLLVYGLHGVISVVLYPKEYTTKAFLQSLHESDKLVWLAFGVLAFLLALWELISPFVLPRL